LRSAEDSWGDCPGQSVARIGGHGVRISGPACDRMGTSRDCPGARDCRCGKCWRRFLTRVNPRANATPLTAILTLTVVASLAGMKSLAAICNVAVHLLEGGVGRQGGRHAPLRRASAGGLRPPVYLTSTNARPWEISSGFVVTIR
jgi:hypothetical protein